VSNKLESLRKQLAAAEENLRKIQERKAKYVQETEVPLQLETDEDHLVERIAKLQETIKREEGEGGGGPGGGGGGGGKTASHGQRILWVFAAVLLIIILLARAGFVWLNEPRARITNLADGQEVAGIVTVIGQYPRILQDDFWIFVQNPDGLYYAQSPDPCNKTVRMPKRHGAWELRAAVGWVDDASKIFEVVLASASPAASLAIAEHLAGACQSGTSLSVGKTLPAGVKELDRRKVMRTAEQWGRAPGLSAGERGAQGTQFGGPPSSPQVQLQGLAEGARLDPTVLITGTYNAPVTGDVWVLVYTFYGRWYPQSIDPCVGQHVRRAGTKWQTELTLGGVNDGGQPYDVVTVLADKSTASAILDKQQRDWCANDNYPGYLTVELPAGLEEQGRVRVYRKPPIWLDTMDAVTGWSTYNDDKGSTSRLDGAPGRGATDQAVQVTYDVKAFGYAGLSKDLWPKTLGGTTGLRFSFLREPPATGDPNPAHTLEVKLIDASDSVFSLEWPDPPVGKWTTCEVPYSAFGCWKDTGDHCAAFQRTGLEPSKVTDLHFAISDRRSSDASGKQANARSDGVIRLDEIVALNSLSAGSATCPGLRVPSFAVTRQP